jgi:hypothetical protein
MIASPTRSWCNKQTFEQRTPPMSNAKYLLCSLLLGVLLAGCAIPINPALPAATVAPAQVAAATPADTDTPSPMPPTPTVQPSVTPALTPAPSPTEVPPTEEPSPTAIPSPTATATPDVPTLIVTSKVANVRAGPGTNYPVIGQVKLGESYALTGRNPASDWWEFRFRDRTGWVSGPLVKTNRTADAIQVAQNVPPSPTPAPTQPPPTAVPTPLAALAQAAEPAAAPAPTAALAATAACPDWFRPPLPGGGVLIIENHHVWEGGYALVEVIGTSGQQRVNSKNGDEPGRLALQLPAGRHTILVEFPILGKRIFDADIEEGRLYVAPVVKPESRWVGGGSEFSIPRQIGTDKPGAEVYPLQPPAGCTW